MEKAKHNSRWWGIFSRTERRIEVTLETKKTLKFRKLSSRVIQSCVSCKTDTVFLSPNEALIVFQTDMDELDDLLRQGSVHLKENVNSELQICSSSLRNEINRLVDS